MMGDSTKTLAFEERFDHLGKHYRVELQEWKGRFWVKSDYWHEDGGKGIDRAYSNSERDFDEYEDARAYFDEQTLDSPMDEVCTMVTYDEDPEFTYCDNCTSEFPTAETRGWRYCPACGAEVRGGGE